jgi:hypothetical protein
MTPEINTELQYQTAIDAGNLFAEWLVWIMVGLIVIALFDRKRLAKNAAKNLREESTSHHKSPSGFSTTHSKKQRAGQIV